MRMQHAAVAEVIAGNRNGPDESWTVQPDSRQNSAENRLRSLTGTGWLCNIYYMETGDDQPLTTALRKAIEECGLSFKALEKETGVLRQSLMKFMRGEQSLRLDIADRLACYFNFEVKPKKKGR